MLRPGPITRHWQRGQPLYTVDNLYHQQKYQQVQLYIWSFSEASAFSSSTKNEVLLDKLRNNAHFSHFEFLWLLPAPNKNQTNKSNRPSNFALFFAFYRGTWFVNLISKICSTGKSSLERDKGSLNSDNCTKVHKTAFAVHATRPRFSFSTAFTRGHDTEKHTGNHPSRSNRNEN